MTDADETPRQRETDRTNDNRLMTPLLLMALIIAGGVLIFAVLGPSVS
ncbi:MAG: hypothetical protein WA776_18610 [Xanthobacteraceae bacterium]